MSRAKLANKMLARLKEELARGSRPGYRAALVGVPLVGGISAKALANSMPLSNKSDVLAKWYGDVVIPTGQHKELTAAQLQPYVDRLRRDLNEYPTLRFPDRAVDAQVKANRLYDMDGYGSNTMLGEALGNMRKIYDMSIQSPDYSKKLFKDYLEEPLSTVRGQLADDELAYSILKAATNK